MPSQPDGVKGSKCAAISSHINVESVSQLEVELEDLWKQVCSTVKASLGVQNELVGYEICRTFDTEIKVL